ncbi:OsmC family protein [Sphingobacterium bovistauri]|uniref:OsmC family protein n=1 Tax=Sphingobacterium bovistauri TaxID=2781959 RepID=A0ABS7Z2I6_9SPHI|nr:OsmC family protein [Sphingobacterium bovistauri]MCA5004371.1 OsmC family protein [Sphingobacterium bovistauri]
MDSTERQSVNAEVVASIGQVNYLTTIVADGKEILGDEPESLGGENKGFNPYELLASSLAMCTAATLKMYAERKELNLGNIDVKVVVNHFTSDKSAVFKKYISFENKNIEGKDMKRLKAIAEACPINKLLSNEILIETDFD